MLDLLMHLRTDSARFRSVLADTDPAASVPTCPGWTASDLFWHLTEVQWFWGAIVRRRAQDRAQVEHERPTRPQADAELPSAFDYHSERLTDALEGAPPEESVYTWSHEQSIGWVARRQAHEALIHRVDAEMIDGSPGAVETDLASDGIDEVLRIVLPSIPPWAHFEPNGDTMRIHAGDSDRSWGVAFGTERGRSPQGEDIERSAMSVGVDAAEPDTVVSGSAVELDLWLWGRGNLEALSIEGNTEAAAQLRQALVDAGR